jgi:RNA polymerase sigma factor (sigma-70 family)
MDPITQEAVLPRSEASASFEEFFRAEFERLFQVLYLSSGNRSEAEDLAQEAMARAYERWDRVRRLESPAGYVYRIGFNLNRRRIRRAALRPRSWVGPAEESDPAEASEAQRDAVRFVSSLPRDLREALLLTKWLDLETSEAARILGIKEVSVRGRVHRATRLLRERFGGIDE